MGGDVGTTCSFWLIFDFRIEQVVNSILKFRFGRRVFCLNQDKQDKRIFNMNVIHLCLVGLSVFAMSPSDCESWIYELHT